MFLADPPWAPLMLGILMATPSNINEPQITSIWAINFSFAIYSLWTPVSLQSVFRHGILVSFTFMSLTWTLLLTSMYTSNYQYILPAWTGNRHPWHFRDIPPSILQLRFTIPETFSIFFQSNLSVPFLKPKTLMLTTTFHFPSQPVRSP